VAFDRRGRDSDCHWLNANDGGRMMQKPEDTLRHFVTLVYMATAVIAVFVGAQLIKSNFPATSAMDCSDAINCPDKIAPRERHSFARSVLPRFELSLADRHTVNIEARNKSWLDHETSP
jgi:hypothetical protein